MGDVHVGMHGEGSNLPFKNSLQKKNGPMIKVLVY